MPKQVLKWLRGKVAGFDTYEETIGQLDALLKDEERYGDITAFLTGVTAMDENGMKDALGKALDFAKTGYDFGTGINILDELTKIMQTADPAQMKTMAADLLKRLQEEKANKSKQQHPPANQSQQKPPSAPPMGQQQKMPFSDDALETVNIHDVEIATVGDYGAKGEITKEMIKMMAENGNTLKDSIKPPVKLGHYPMVDTGLPSLGWVDNLRVSSDGTTLIGSFMEVPKTVAELIRAKAYRRLSPEIYMDEVPSDLKDRAKPPILRAVALLGQDIPAMKTLDDVRALYGETAGNILFVEGNRIIENRKKAEEDRMKGTIDKLLRENVEGKVSAFIEAQKAKVMPSMVPVLRTLLVETLLSEEGAENPAVISFSETVDGKPVEKKMKFSEAIMSLVERMGTAVDFGERGTRGQDLSQGEPSELARMEKAQELADKDGITFTEAYDKLYAKKQ